MLNAQYVQKEKQKNFFLLPNALFDIELHIYALAIYAYLIRIEDRNTYQCIASYAHITNDMQREAAYSIDRGIGKINEPYSLEHKSPVSKQEEEFVPITNAPRRKPGMGCITEINDHLYEGRWSPRWIGGKRISRNVYATTREECEAKLAQLIRESKIELAELKRAQKKASKPKTK